MKIVIITLIVYWAICTLLANWHDDWLPYLAMGLVYPILYVVFYPVRAWHTYSSSETYYKKKGISRTKYISWVKWQEELKWLRWLI